MDAGVFIVIEGLLSVTFHGCFSPISGDCQGPGLGRGEKWTKTDVLACIAATVRYVAVSAN